MATITTATGAIQTAYASYASYTITESPLILYWNNLATPEGVAVFAANMSIKTELLTAQVFLPSYLESTAGQNCIIKNDGTESFDIVYETIDSSVIAASIDSGQSYYLVLTDHETNIWQASILANQPPPIALNLAGKGLELVNDKLNVVWGSTTVTGSTYDITTADYAKNILVPYTNESLTINVSSTANLPIGFYTSILNNSDQIIILSASGLTINESTITLFIYPNQSFLLIYPQAGNLFTIGRDDSKGALSFINIVIPSGETEITPSISELINELIQFTAPSPTGAIRINFDNGAGTWTILNSTSVTLNLYASSTQDPSDPHIVLEAGASKFIWSNGFSFIGSYPIISSATNTALGLTALGSNTSGFGNTAVGANALNTNTIASRNTAVGANALALNTAADNTAVGSTALDSNTSGTRNTAVGANALTANVSSSQNTAVGYSALAVNTAADNTAFGSFSLDFNTTGTKNTAVGSFVLSQNETGSENTAVGHNALYYNEGANNTALGVSAASSLVSDSSCTAVGYNAGNGTAPGGDNNNAFGANSTWDSGLGSLENTTVIGCYATGSASHSIILGGHSPANDVYYPNVGIGTTAPLTSLHVGKTHTDNRCSIALQETDVVPDAVAGFVTIYYSGGNIYFKTTAGVAFLTPA